MSEAKPKTSDFEEAPEMKDEDQAKELAEQVAALKKENSELKDRLGDAMNRELRGRRTMDFFAECFESQVQAQQNYEVREE